MRKTTENPASTARPLLVASTLAIAGLMAQGAAADTLKYGGAAFPNYDGSYTLRDSNPTSFSVTGNAGGFKITDVSGPTLPAGKTFVGWCIDIYDTMYTGSSGKSYREVNGANFFGSAYTNGPTTYSSSTSYINKDLERLASYVFDKTTSSFAAGTVWSNGHTYASNVQSAAFQLAIWEIVDEKSGGVRTNGAANYNVNSGDFYVTGGDSNARTLANLWLNWLDGSTALNYAIDQDLQVWQQTTPHTTQNLAMFVPTVPEPETYAMLMAGLGLMGFVARRRKQSAG